MSRCLGKTQTRSRVFLPGLLWLSFPRRNLTGCGVCTQRLGCCRRIMAVSDMALQFRRWLQGIERLIAVSAAVGEAIAFPGLAAAAVLPRETGASPSRASASDFSANGLDRLHSGFASYLCLNSRGLVSPRSMHPCGGIRTPFRASGRLFIPTAAFGLTRSIPQL